MEQKLTERVAIVTGSGQGIGRAIAVALAAAGARVAVNDINPDRAARVAGEIDAAGGEALAISADVANKFQCVHLIETTRARWHRLDILVNNAAVTPVSSILKLDEWEWDRCLDVNLKGTFFMSQLCGRVMADQRMARQQRAEQRLPAEVAGDPGGVIVNISSVAGVATPLPLRAAYCASKAGIVGFARECAREFAAFGVRVNTVLAGAIDTPLSRSAQARPETAIDWESHSPLGRPGQAAEVANAVLFLCSDASSYMTGSSVTVAGGQVMP